MSLPCSKVRFAYQQPVGAKLAGWGTTFWNQGTDIQSVRLDANVLAQRLQALTGLEAFVASFTISTYPSNRNAESFPTGYTSTVSPMIQSARDSDYPTSAVQVQQYGTTLRNSVWLSGIPDGVVANGGNYTPGGEPSWVPAFNALQSYLNAGSGGWILVGLNKNSVPAMIGDLNTLTGIVTFDTTGDLSVVVGAINRVRIKGLGVRNRFNGLWRLKVLTATTMQLLNFRPDPVNVPYTSKNPQAKLQVYITDTYSPTRIIKVNRATKHNRGKPTNLLTGRRTKRAS